MLIPRFGFLDRRFVIPVAAVDSCAGARGGKRGYAAGLLVTPPGERCATAGRELVDLCGPVIQTRIHFVISFCRSAINSWCARLVRGWLLESISSVPAVSAT